MASDVDICNLALSHLGETQAIASINPSDGSTHADYCVIFYPMARDAVLERHAWNFATRRVAMAELDQDAPSSWTYRYALPTQCLRVLAVLAEDSVDGDDSKNYVQEIDEDGNTCILTDVPNATVRYISRVTDTTKYSPLAILCISRLLASYLAGPITKSTSEAEAQERKYEFEMGRATSSDANAHRPKTQSTHKPSWVANR